MRLSFIACLSAMPAEHGVVDGDGTDPLNPCDDDRLARKALLEPGEERGHVPSPCLRRWRCSAALTPTTITSASYRHSGSAFNRRTVSSKGCPGARRHRRPFRGRSGIESDRARNPGSARSWVLTPHPTARPAPKISTRSLLSPGRARVRVVERTRDSVQGHFDSGAPDPHHGRKSSPDPLGRARDPRRARARAQPRPPIPSHPHPLIAVMQPFGWTALRS